jgi:hypothetical protein
MADASKGAADEGLSVIGMVLAAVSGGIGALSFVAFFGAAILWVRMDEAGIPGNEAVAVVPKSVLVTTGSSFLVPSLLAALGFTVLLYLAEQATQFLATWSLRGSERKLAEAKREAERSQTMAKKALENVELAAQRSRELKAAARASVAGGADPAAVRHASSEASEAVTDAQEVAAQAQPIAQKADEGLMDAIEQAELMRDTKQRSIELTRKVVRLILTAALFAAGAIAGVRIFSVGLPPERIVVLVILWAVLTAACLIILASKSFAWFAMATFVAVGLLSGCLTYFRTVDNPKVEPAAVLRTHGAPVFGFFVAQTSDRVYIATRLPLGPIRLDSIPREEVTDMAIAELLKPARAELRARRLARQMCVIARERSSPEQSAAQISGGSKPGRYTEEGPCTLADLHRLSRSVSSTGDGIPATQDRVSIPPHL